jgi:hypothetical protein
MKLKLIIFLSSLLFPILLGAQNVVVRGQVYYVDSSQPLPFATIKVSNTNTEVLSDDRGKYTVNASENDTLVCSYVGCISKQVVVNGQSIVNIVLAPDTLQLKDIVVTGKRRPVQMSTDGLVVDVSDMRTEGKLLTEILNQMPTIKVNDQSINMSGKSSVMVYINHRQVYLQGQDLIAYLNSLSPDIIKKVEIISTPPVQYEAEGNIGVVDIETSRNVNPGWQGTVQTLYRQAHYSSAGSSAHFSYRGKKFSLDGIFLGSMAKEYTKSNYKNYFPDETVSTNYPRRDKEKILRSLLTFVYDINKKNQLSVMFQIPLYNRTKTIDLDNTTKYNHISNFSLDSVMTSKGDELNKKYLFSSEAFYKHTFNDNSGLTMTVGYINNYVNNNRSWLSSVESKGLRYADENYISQGRQKYNIYTAKTDYSIKIKDWKLDGGGKVAYTHSSSNNRLSMLNGNGLIDNLLASDHFDYDELIDALYANISKTFDHVSVKFGLRAEYTHSKGYSYSLEETDKNHYFRLFPVVGLMYTISNKNIFGLSYAGRVERPQYQMLNPFRWYISKYDYSVGDPFLKPAYINNLELTYLHDNAFYCKLYYSHTSNEVGRMVFLDTLNIQNQIEKAGNYLSISTLGLNVNYTLRSGSWFESTLSNDLMYSMYGSNSSAFRKIVGWGCEFSVDNYFHVGNNIVLSLYAEDDVPGYYNYRKNNNSFLLNTGISFVNNKKNFVLRLNANDILKTSNPKYCYYSNGIRQEFHNYYDSRYVNLTLIWKFGNIFNKSKNYFDSSNSEERDRL